MNAVPLVTLVILDGWGIAPPGPGNAISLSRTPVFDGLVARYPTTELRASGPAVGLPEGQMGNSEVGHLTIGSGRILLQDLVRVSRAVEDGSLFANEALTRAFARARERDADVHLLGLVSSGGVHSHIDHLRALLAMAEREGLAERTWVHAFTDGRDVSPYAAIDDLANLPAERLATIVGRYYAMDRDKRWERTDRALDAIVGGTGTQAEDPVEAIRASYGAGVTDEFVEPIVLEGRPRLDPAKDVAIAFNFRPDRVRQLTERLLDAGVDVVTMTRYRDDFPCPVAFGEQAVPDTLAETLSAAGLTQLHAAETEKYAHVTYFFNGGVEAAWPGEERILVPSPRDVPSYDRKPEMSAAGVAASVASALEQPFAFCVVNFANPDMVGHTGVIPAVVRAVETVDTCLREVVEATHRAGGVCLVTADHGNAEALLEEDGASLLTAHTTNPVPLVVTREGIRVSDGGELSDLAPTVLDLLGLAPPPVMTGASLVSADR
ncbi:2,3-bisphosphoglycerate-independent phosphoglycerate mutase [Gaiella sp.]|uniref:2,3-bisphosphoglycerate-independent phosphoglycerate mutase n=1 Tax=Gaiella sp. TaxID=2663207 RepID=UPI002E336BA5|nr:2,3-bisphosphoglycerate-independent phosphoglycerate mutase [Gaiella sp.]HEX5584911.1 2,3-bisphosphoglycerate-independent phosphoglycerate mutase [Gaiella sp.]